MRKSDSIGILAAAAMAILGGCASSGTQHASATGGPSGAKAYPLKTCIVTDEALDKDATVFVHQGQEIKLCCDGCKEDFDKEPAKYLKKIAGK